MVCLAATDSAAGKITYLPIVIMVVVDMRHTVSYKIESCVLESMVAHHWLLISLPTAAISDCYSDSC